MAITDLIANNMSFDPVGSYMKGYGASQAIASNKRAGQIQEQEAAIQQQKIALAEKEDMRARGQEFVLSISPVIEKINSLGTPEEKQAAYSQAIPVLAKQAQDLGLPGDKLPPQWDQNQADMILGAAQRLGGVERFSPGNVIGEDTFTQVGSGGTVKKIPLGKGEKTSDRKGAETLATELAKVTPDVIEGKATTEQQKKLKKDFGEIQAKAVKTIGTYIPKVAETKKLMQGLLVDPNFKAAVGAPNPERALSKASAGTPVGSWIIKANQVADFAETMAAEELRGLGPMTEKERETIANGISRIKAMIERGDEKGFVGAVKDFNTQLDISVDNIRRMAKGDFDVSKFLTDEKPVSPKPKQGETYEQRRARILGK